MSCHARVAHPAGRPAVARCGRPALFAAAAALAAVGLAAPPPAHAARVEQVRVGDHADYTRIVIETDAPATYRWETRETPTGPELVVDLDAASSTRVVASRSRLVENVTLRPDADGATARIALRTAPVDVKEMVLKSPNRIVLDLRPAPERATAVARAEPEPAEEGDDEMESVATTAEPEPEAPATSEAIAPDAAAPSEEAEPGPTALASSEEVGPEDTTIAEEPEPMGAEPDVLERREVDRAAPEMLGEVASEPGAEAAAEPGAATQEPGRVAQEPGRVAAGQASRTPPSAAEPAAEPGWLERLGSGDPVVGLAAVGAGLLVLFLTFLAVRRRTRRIAQEAAATPWPPPGAEERPEFAAEPAAAGEAEAGAAAEELSPHVTGEPEATGPLFAGPSRPEVAPEPEEGPRAAASAASAASGVGAASGVEPEVEAKEADAAPLLEELERRIERLEARVADGLDARERLERQLAAHTEELRVQRAAIARTQRAVRAAVRGPESGGEGGSPPSAAGGSPSGGETGGGG